MCGIYERYDNLCVLFLLVDPCMHSQTESTLVFSFVFSMRFSLLGCSNIFTSGVVLWIELYCLSFLLVFSFWLSWFCSFYGHLTIMSALFFTSVGFPNSTVNLYLTPSCSTILLLISSESPLVLRIVISLSQSKPFSWTLYVTLNFFCISSLTLA